MGKEKSNREFEFLPTSLFEKALDALKPAYMKLIIVLAYGILVVYMRQEGPTEFSLVLVIVAILLLAGLALLLEYVDKKLRYSQKTAEKLKTTLREVVWERQKELRLIQIIDEYFEDELELRELIQRFHLAFPNYLTDYDNLSVQGKKLAMICGLVNYCHRRGIVDALSNIVRQLRPNATI